MSESEEKICAELTHEELQTNAKKFVEDFFKDNKPVNTNKKIRKFLEDLITAANEKNCDNTSISTYDFIYYITVFIRERGTEEIIGLLLAILQEDAKKEKIIKNSLSKQQKESQEYMQSIDRDSNFNNKNKKIAFAAYYATSLYYKRHGMKTEQLRLVKKYNEYFDFAILNNEILARYSRQKKEYLKALEYDKLSLDLVLEDNDALKTSYCSTVLNILEDDTLSLSSEDKEKLFETACRYSRYVVEKRPKYGKYHCIYGRLLLIQANNSVNDDEKYSENLRLAKQELSTAVKCENKTDKDYMNRVAGYERYLHICETKLIVIEVADKNTKKIKEVQKEIEEKNTKEIKTIMRDFKTEIILLLGLFTAIITIMITTVQTAATGKYFVPHTLAIVVLIASLSIILIYCVLRVLFADIGGEKPNVDTPIKIIKMCAAVITSLIIILLLIHYCM